MEAFGGKIIVVNLSEGDIKVLNTDISIYRKYMGGPGIGLYYLLKELPIGADPLGEDNIMVFAPGLVVGTCAPAIPRYTVCAKSPLTGGIGKSEAGGFWGPELRKAGYDAVIVRGKSNKPVYLKIVDKQVELVDASHLWGKGTGEVHNILKSVMPKSRILQIGPAGENMVKLANICNELAHFNGRNGLGAVMGSKLLKAIVVQGSGSVYCSDEEKLKETTRWVAQNYREHPLAYGLYYGGTAAGVATVNAGGTLPTNNWTKSTFDGAEKISGEAINESILVNRKGCFSCPIKCKRVVSVKEERFEVSPEFGGPEYETLVALGSNCGISDLNMLAKANELCNNYTIDTISMGMTVSFAMNCFEERLLTIADTGGIELRFGDGQTLLKLIEMTAKRQGFGNELAEGSANMARKIGEESYKFLREVKGQEIPMHDPRVKTGLGLQYALAYQGADHWMAQHDQFFAQEGSMGIEAMAPLGITSPVAARDLSWEKARLFYYTHLLTMAYDCIGVCAFGYVARSIVSIEQLVDIVKAVTGWRTSLFELIKAGERVSNMMRCFNIREGFTKEDDRIPDIFFQDINSGPLAGKNAIDKKDFYNAIGLFYEIAGWDNDGIPTKGKLNELGLDWLV